jgi:hypothetical protein
MKAVQYLGPGKLELKLDVPMPQAGEGVQAPLPLRA